MRYLNDHIKAKINYIKVCVFRYLFDILICYMICMIKNIIYFKYISFNY